MMSLRIVSKNAKRHPHTSRTCFACQKSYTPVWKDAFLVDEGGDPECEVAPVCPACLEDGPDGMKAIALLTACDALMYAVHRLNRVVQIQSKPIRVNDNVLAETQVGCEEAARLEQLAEELVDDL
jgi:hypothetical protein